MSDPQEVVEAAVARLAQVDEQLNLLQSGLTTIIDGAQSVEQHRQRLDNVAGRTEELLRAVRELNTLATSSSQQVSAALNEASAALDSLSEMAAGYDPDRLLAEVTARVGRLEEAARDQIRAGMGPIVEATQRVESLASTLDGLQTDVIQSMFDSQAEQIREMGQAFNQLEEVVTELRRKMTEPSTGNLHSSLARPIQMLLVLLMILNIVQIVIAA
jgi:uncharacterized phage infection (PIP) family protein YhgE